MCALSVGCIVLVVDSASASGLYTGVESYNQCMWADTWCACVAATWTTESTDSALSFPPVSSLFSPYVYVYV